MLYGVIPNDSCVILKIINTINQLSSLVKTLSVIIVKNEFDDGDINQIDNEVPFNVLPLSLSTIKLDRAFYQIENLIMHFYESNSHMMIDIPSIVAGDAQILFGLINNLWNANKVDEAINVARNNPSALLNCYIISYYSAAIVKNIVAIGPKFSVEDRQTGSTTKLIDIQDKINCGLVVANVNIKRQLLHSYGDRNILTFDEVLNNRYTPGTPYRPILVDDANYILTKIFAEKGFDIIKAVIKNDENIAIFSKDKMNEEK